MSNLMRVPFLAAAIGLGGIAGSAESPQSVTGTATYRERIALPASALFEAVLLDVSRADAPALELARVETEGPGPLYSFGLPYDPAAIDGRNSYAVRASVRVEGRLRFTTDTFHPVITRGAPTEVDIVMIGVDTP